MRRLIVVLAGLVLGLCAPAQAQDLDISPAPDAAELAGEGWERIFDGRNDELDHSCVPLAPGLVQPWSSDGKKVKCVIPPQARLFIQFGGYCASWDGVTDAVEQLRCASGLDDEVRSLKLSVRGQTVELDQPAFAFVTGRRALETAEGPQTFVAAGHAAIVSGLRAGDKLTLDVVAEQFAFTFRLRVR